MINFKTKQYIKDGVTLIDNGVAVNGYSIRETPVSVEELENLYHSYKFSIPTEKEENKRKPYFKALSIDELTSEALFLGINREIAREQLELTLLEGILNRSITWDILHGGNWFWQSKNDGDFIILKEWVEN